MAESETCGWIFVDFIPLLYEKKKVARQFQVEMWLNLAQLVKELNIEKIDYSKHDTGQPINYIA